MWTFALGILSGGQELLNIPHLTGQPPATTENHPQPTHAAGLMRVRTLVCAGEETEARRSSQVVSGGVPGLNLDSPGAQPCPPPPSVLAGGLTWCPAMPSALAGGLTCAQPCPPPPSALAGGRVQSPARGFHSLSKACFSAHQKARRTQIPRRGPDRWGRQPARARAPAGGGRPPGMGAQGGHGSSFSRKPRNPTLSKSALNFSV